MDDVSSLPKTFSSQYSVSVENVLHYRSKVFCDSHIMFCCFLFVFVQITLQIDPGSPHPATTHFCFCQFVSYIPSLKTSHTEQMVGDVWLVNCSRCKTPHTARRMPETLKGYFTLIYDFLSSIEHMDYLCVIFGAQLHPLPIASFPFVLHKILLYKFGTRPVMIIN